MRIGFRPRRETRHLLKQRVADHVSRVLERWDLALVPAHQTWPSQWRETLENLEVGLAFDVGANVGQWYRRFRAAGFTCPVISFEPDPRAIAILRQLQETLGDPHWTIQGVALGDRSDGQADFYQWPLTEGGSSLKEATEFGARFTQRGPESITRTSVGVRRFDDLYRPESLANRNALLKVDVQGYEAEVLGGLGSCLQHFSAIEIEIPLVHIYSDEGSFVTIMRTLMDGGFLPWTIQSERWRGGGYGVADCDVLLVNSRLTDAR